VCRLLTNASVQDRHLWNTSDSKLRGIRAPMCDAVCRSFRIELVDEPADSVQSLLEAYHSVLHERQSPQEVFKALQRIPDANGNVHGCVEGSLAVTDEVPWHSMKQTAAAERPYKSRHTREHS
jgi:hypothetical protein